MKKLSLGFKLLIGLVLIGFLFFGGIYSLQYLSEKKLVTATVVGELEQLDMQSEMDAMNQMTVREYYTEFIKMPEKAIADFEKKYSIDADKAKAMEMTSEESSYMFALGYLLNEAKAPILSKNEKQEKNDTYRMSLETSLADTNALSGGIDSTKPIIEICEKYGVDPDGKVSDLTAEIIAEMDQKLYEISDHPKE